MPAGLADAWSPAEDTTPSWRGPGWRRDAGETHHLHRLQARRCLKFRLHWRRRGQRRRRSPWWRRAHVLRRSCTCPLSPAGHRRHVTPAYSCARWGFTAPCVASPTRALGTTVAFDAPDLGNEGTSVAGIASWPGVLTPLEHLGARATVRRCVRAARPSGMADEAFQPTRCSAMVKVTHPHRPPPPVRKAGWDQCLYLDGTPFWTGTPMVADPTEGRTLMMTHFAAARWSWCCACHGRHCRGRDTPCALVGFPDPAVDGGGEGRRRPKPAKASTTSSQAGAISAWRHLYAAGPHYPGAGRSEAGRRQAPPAHFRGATSPSARRYVPARPLSDVANMVRHHQHCVRPPRTRSSWSEQTCQPISRSVSRHHAALEVRCERDCGCWHVP